MNDSKQRPIAMHAVIVYARSCKKEQSQVNNERNTDIYILVTFLNVRLVRTK